jgi:DUF1009 family protein
MIPIKLNFSEFTENLLMKLKIKKIVQVLIISEDATLQAVIFRLNLIGLKFTEKLLPTFLAPIPLVFPSYYHLLIRNRLVPVCS